MVVRDALKLPPVNESASVSNPAEFAREESTANPAAYGVKKLQASLYSSDASWKFEDAQ